MKIRVVRVAIGAGALVLAGLSGAVAQEEGVAMKSILGAIGIIPKDKPVIDYRERAPLVVPPKLELRAPADKADVEARIANWPKDPDREAARAEAAEARTPDNLRQRYKLDKGDRLSIEEMRAGRRLGGSVAAVDPAGQDNRSDRSRMSPDELRSYTSQPKLDPNGLERRSLVDPPQPLLRAAGGQPLKATADPVQVGDPDSPHAFIRERQQRR